MRIKIHGVAHREKHEVDQFIQAQNGYILKCNTSPDGKLLATCSLDKTAKIWSLAPNKCPLSYISSSKETLCVEENAPLTSASSRYGLVRTLQGHQRWVWNCAFSAISSYLVTCYSDQTARRCDLCQKKSSVNTTAPIKLSYLSHSTILFWIDIYILMYLYCIQFCKLPL